MNRSGKLILASSIFFAVAVSVSEAQTNYTLTIAGNPGNYDSPTNLSYGIHTNITDNTWITNTVTSPAETNGARYACLGWNVTTNGTTVTNDTNIQAVFQLITNMTLTWNWTNTHNLLTVTQGANGTATTNVSGWYTNGLEAAGISATGLAGYVFSQWTGDVPADDVTNNPLTVTMDQARVIQANFASTTSETKTCTGTGNWASSTNWSPEGMPGPLQSTGSDLDY